MTFSPASLVLSAGDVGMVPVRLSYGGAVLTIGVGTVSLGPDMGTGLIGRNIRLDRLMRDVPIGGPSGPSMQFQALWQKNCEAIEAAFNAQQGQINEIQQILAGLQAAQQAAAEANQKAESIDSSITLANSKTDPVDGILTASSDGIVTISAHSRVYTYSNGVVVIVPVDAGSVSGFAQGDFVRIVYVDAAREGGAVSYHGTLGEATQTGDTHVVGGVTIPAAGSPPSSGTGTTPPGYVRPSSLPLD